MSYTVAIVGRANVGKTTIFNKLVGKRAAIVSDYVGVTRDRNEVLCDYYGLKVNFVDSAGIEFQNQKGVIEKQMFVQALKGIDLADLCLFVVDCKSGIIDADVDVYNILRKKNKTTVLVINKVDCKRNIDISEFFQFNTVKEKILLSAEHNYGFDDLYQAIKAQYSIWLPQQSTILANEVENTNSKIRIAVLGRPNAGKSTFLNNLLNSDRLITSEIAGTTRDKIELDFSYNGTDFVLIDTAGIRKKYKNGDHIEFFSVEKSLEALQFADVVVVIMDVTIAMEEQDLLICQKVCNEGRILVVCFNKWDLVPSYKEEQLLENLKKVIRKSVSQVKGIVFFTCSALNDKNLVLMFSEIIKLYKKWNEKISAGKINKKIIEAKQTMNVINELKVRYINQIKIRPPTFVVFSGKNEKDITTQNVESVKNWLYREFELTGIPIRISFRGKNKQKRK